MSPRAATASTIGVKSQAYNIAPTGIVCRMVRALRRMSGAAVAAMLVSRDHARSGRSVASAVRSSPATCFTSASSRCRCFERRSAHLFFQLVARRYERGSLLITTNQLVTQWGAVFGDDVLAAAILDRLLHHSHTLMIQGESYRLRQKKKAGLLGRAQRNDD